MNAAPALHEHEFQRLTMLVRARVGIALGPHKRPLVRGRLWKRLRARGLSSYDEYLELVEREPDELVELTNAITTNKTSFYREAHHHAPLVAHVTERMRRRRTQPIAIWSAACSSGEEPYSFLVALGDALGIERLTQVRVLATDVDTRVLECAQRAVYPAEALEPVPPSTRQRFFVEGTGEKAGLVRVRRELRRQVRFHELNLIAGNYPLPRARFEVIACRNVLIYFDPPTQRAVVEQLLTHLVPGGLILLGHSESMLGNRADLARVAPTAWRLR